MAYFFRLIFALTALFASAVHADQDYTEYRICSAAGCQYFDSQWVGSAASANSAYWSWMDSTQPACSNNYNHFDYVPAGVNTEQTYGQGTRTQTEYSISGCTGNAYVYPPTTQSVQIMKRISTCLSPNVVVDNSCVPPPPPCEPPNVIKDGVCGPPDPPKCNYPPGAGMPDTLFQMGGGANYKGGYICYLNCEAVPDMRGQKDGKWYHWGPYKSTGATCANSTGDSTGGQPTPDNPDGSPPPPDPDAPPRDPPPPPPEPPPEQCKKGTCPGTINGTTVCMPCSETRSPQPVPGAPPNAPPTPPDPTGNNAPPDTKNTTQSATNCKDGKCTTTTTKSTTDANGVTTTNSHSTTESKDDFCTSNPRSSMCIDGAFGGACDGGFVCEGDAVQCAMAKEQHARNCKLFEDFDGVEAQLYETEKGKGGSVIGDVPGGSSHAFGAASFDSSDALNAGMGGPQDRSVTVMGQTLLLKFSTVTPYLAMLGNLLLAISFLIAARIFLRG